MSKWARQDTDGNVVGRNYAMEFNIQNAPAGVIHHPTWQVPEPFHTFMYQNMRYTEGTRFNVQCTEYPNANITRWQKQRTLHEKR